MSFKFILKPIHRGTIVLSENKTYSITFYKIYLIHNMVYIFQEIVEYKRQNDSIQEFNKYTKTSTVDEIYMEPCDILIFAATHRSLQCYVAENVLAKIVVEAAHAAIIPTAHKILLARKRLVLPDIFAGCGASVTSYLEYIKHLQLSPQNILISR